MGLFSKRHFQGVTLTELIMVAIIVAVLATIAAAFLVPKSVLERHAKTTLKIIWQAERDYFAYKGVYTNSWRDLNLDDPNVADSYYTYTFTKVGADLEVTATRRGTSSGFKIDRNGTITTF